MSEIYFDWDMDMALEIGLVAEATMEAQEKLNTMHEAYVENYQHTSDSMIGTLPRAVLESEAKQMVKSERDSAQYEIKNLKQTIKDLEWKNQRLNDRLVELRMKIDKLEGIR